MSFLGPVGAIIPVKCASQLTSSGGRQVSFEDTLGKRKAFLGKVKARQWSVDIGLAKPSELSGLRWLAENVNTPMVWYAPDAVVGNILPPDQAALVPGTYYGIEGPLVEVESGVVVKSAIPNGNFLYMTYRDDSLSPLPVVPNHPVTVSAWMRGGTFHSHRLEIVWHDFKETELSTQNTDFEVTDKWVRRAFTVTPPAGATHLVFRVAAGQVAGPAATLTKRLTSYAPGLGATSVVAHGLSDAVIRATEDQQLGSLSFTVSEVG